MTRLESYLILACLGAKTSEIGPTPPKAPAIPLNGFSTVTCPSGNSIQEIYSDHQNLGGNKRKFRGLTINFLSPQPSMLPWPSSIPSQCD